MSGNDRVDAAATWLAETASNAGGVHKDEVLEEGRRLHASTESIVDALTQMIVRDSANKVHLINLETERDAARTRYDQRQEEIRELREQIQALESRAKTAAGALEALTEEIEGARVLVNRDAMARLEVAECLSRVDAYMVDLARSATTATVATTPVPTLPALPERPGMPPAPSSLTRMPSQK